MIFVKPDTAELNNMLAMVSGEDSKAKPDGSFKSSDMCFQAQFVDDGGALVACCYCDLPTAAALGCALSMIPPGGAEAMVEDGEISSTAAENLYEVMNILSSLFMSNTTPHLKLSEVVNETFEPLEAANSSSFNIDLGKYGNGKLLFEAA
ncbi:MAG: hypothetical protein V3U65_16280 [Granulosicoccaceae bacterium]